MFRLNFSLMNSVRRNISILILILANTGLDQLTKNLVRKHIDYFEKISLIDQYVLLTRIENSGAFLSTGESLEDPVKLVFLTILPVIGLCFGIYYLLTNSKLPYILVIGVSLIIGGGLGNLYDRYVYGTVTDFLYIDLHFFRTGIFNIADVSILLGVLMTLFKLKYKRSITEEHQD